MLVKKQFLFITLIGLATLSTLKAQTPMRTFDFEKYNALRKKDKTYYASYQANDSTEITLDLGDAKSPDDPYYYVEEITQNSKSLKTTYWYYSSGKLSYECTQLAGMIIGSERSYDQNGNITEEINYDERFPFSIKEVCQLMQKVWGVNIFDKRDLEKHDVGISIERTNDIAKGDFYWYKKEFIPLPKDYNKNFEGHNYFYLLDISREENPDYTDCYSTLEPIEEKHKHAYPCFTENIMIDGKTGMIFGHWDSAGNNILAKDSLINQETARKLTHQEPDSDWTPLFNQ